MSSPDLARDNDVAARPESSASLSLSTSLGRRALVILLVLDLSYLINAMDRQVFAVLLPDIKATYLLSGGQAGTLSTIFTLGMGLAGIPAGYLADRVGRKKLILASLLVFSVSCALQAAAVGVADMALWRILSGVGEGMQNAALYAAVGAYFARHRGVAIGSVNAAFGLGAFTGPLLGGALRSATGDWRIPLVVFGGLGLLILALVYLTVPRSVTEVGRGSTGADTGGAAPLPGLLNQRVVCAACAAVAGGFTIYGYLGLYPTYLREAHGFTPAQASWAASMFGLGAVGSVLCGVVADRVNQRAFNMAGFLGIAVLGIGIFGFAAPFPIQMILSLLLGVAFTGIVYTNTSSLMQRSVDVRYVGRVSGLFVAAMYIPASVSGYVFAALQAHLGWRAAGLVQLSVIPLLGLVAMAAMPTRRTR
ncbi:MFS transporter [Pseudonocardia spinosispora]|uniref:MFS transporter n=1 Tax=Pseudonocardia spinosispora TaxID=103441 RepID=UPI0004232A5A|nr:MFS transporter [Pseudonocardia spinosispora]